MPAPLSTIRIISLPPARNSIVMSVAPASRAFSRSSFTIDEGRSMTSPAAIFEATSSGRTVILCSTSRQAPLSVNMALAGEVVVQGHLPGPHGFVSRLHELAVAQDRVGGAL